MTIVALSLGSNTNPAHYLASALGALYERFGALRVSSVFESEAVGFSGDNFLNLAVVIDTNEKLEDLALFLKGLEDRHGRSRQEPRFSGRTLDIDILTYGEMHGEFAGIVLPREEIVDNAYVLWPLSEILGEGMHPPTGKTYSQLWTEYDKTRQRLWPVAFSWENGSAPTGIGYFNSQ
ncbi:MAG: 2-amino-4-hydroxy-6-hydroxymethyldihydropteridine diphosphokinase [Gammaproteobacteria bacterium]|nr:2-amino-4-hydroxy-6-hydroxymethyldihydropteridine diphosphokinase [Gammaproteobacteria bacterium]MDP2141425.1 2-amino-4-hydroxy-6-hydroxymethyldihydropteridine diphosphokinase [Gammaproteobacteria bacterium]MDP2346411.1 2-amino-4-hydroxy-6-hydroxymethyldihydropteridine diphosphokinase [Gammaproteobacteria bacterium]